MKFTERVLDIQSYTLYPNPVYQFCSCNIQSIYLVISLDKILNGIMDYACFRVDDPAHREQILNVRSSLSEVQSVSNILVSLAKQFVLYFVPNLL